MTNAVQMTYKVAIDWDGDGSFSTSGDDITAYVKRVDDITLGINSQMEQVAYVGTLTFTVNNADRRFSPSYSAGVYYGKLIGNKSVRVQITDGVTTWTLFWGFTRKFDPDSGQYGQRECKITCVDSVQKIQAEMISLPLQQSVSGDVLIKHIVNTALKAPVATGTLTIAAGNAANNNTYQVANVTYTFKTSLSGGSNEVLIGASISASATNLAAAINLDVGAGTTYANTTTTNTSVTAAASAGVVTVTALVRGAWGNAITQAVSGANLSVSGATLSGGADYPTTPTPSYQVGNRVFDYAADTWSTTSKTNGMDAIKAVTRSEWGMFWVARDGTLTWKNSDFLFLQASASAALTLSSQHNALDNAVDSSLIYNIVDVQYIPRSTLASGVVAQATAKITVPPSSGKTRFNSTTPVTAGNIMVKLPFVDPTTGKPCGAQSIITPLVAGTDWTAQDSGGVSYTNAGNLSFSLVINGGDIEISIVNTATIPLIVTMLKVRGTGIVTYNPSHSVVEDTTSEDTNGQQQLPAVELKLNTGQVFADSLAQYLLSRYKDPHHRILSITFNGQNKIGSVNLFSLEIGNVIAVTDFQTGITSSAYLIIGIRYSGIKAKDTGSITFDVFRLDDAIYATYDTTVYDADITVGGGYYAL